MFYREPIFFSIYINHCHNIVPLSLVYNLELDILDFISEEDSFVIYTDSSDFIKIKEALEKKGIDKFLISEVTFVPNNYISLDEETTEKVTNLIDALTDLDDVQAVYHNLEI